MRKLWSQRLKKKMPEVALSYYSSEETGISKEINNLRLRLRRTYVLLSLLIVSLSLLGGTQLWLFFSKDRDLIVLHDAGSGMAWITQERGRITPTDAATQSNIANYIKMRESYVATSFAHQYREINQQSSPTVALTYRRQESAAQKNSLLRRMDRLGIRKIKVEDIILLPFKPSQKHTRSIVGHPFAEVHFTSIEMTGLSASPKVRTHTALISWGYSGMPSDPEERLTNWMGFRVYYYKVTDKQ